MGFHRFRLLCFFPNTAPNQLLSYHTGPAEFKGLELERLVFLGLKSGVWLANLLPKRTRSERRESLMTQVINRKSFQLKGLRAREAPWLASRGPELGRPGEAGKRGKFSESSTDPKARPRVDEFVARPMHSFASR